MTTKSKRSTGLAKRDSQEETIEREAQMIERVVTAITPAMSSGIERGMSQAFAQALGNKLAESVLGAKSEQYYLDERRQMLDDAMNVIVGFQITVTQGNTVRIVGGYEVNDAPTARSIRRLCSQAREMAIEGSELVTHAPDPESTEGKLKEADSKAGAPGSLFKTAD